MSLFISIMFLVVASILASVAGNAWAKGGYHNAVVAMWWGIAAFLVLGVGALFTYYAYVIKPAKVEAVQRPAKSSGTSNTALEKTLRTSNRASLGVSSLQASLKAKQVKVLIENTGIPNEGRLKVWVVAVIQTEGPTPIKAGDQMFDFGHTQVFRNGIKLPIVLDLDISPEEAEIILVEKHSLTIGITIFYQDGFGNDATPTFGFRYKPPPNEDWFPVRMEHADGK